jgi:hypothetical protein
LIDLYRAIAAGEIKPVSNDGADGLAGLQFLESEIDKRVASRVVARCLTIQQVSVLTHVHYDAVSGWVSSGLLPAKRELHVHGSPWAIELQSLVTFLLMYSPVATQAAACGTTSRALSAMLNGYGVEAVEIGPGRGALFKLSSVLNAMRSIERPA